MTTDANSQKEWKKSWTNLTKAKFTRQAKNLHVTRTIVAAPKNTVQANEAEVEAKKENHHVVQEAEVETGDAGQKVGTEVETKDLVDLNSYLWVFPIVKCLVCLPINL